MGEIAPPPLPGFELFLFLVTYKNAATTMTIKTIVITINYWIVSAPLEALKSIVNVSRLAIVIPLP